MIKKLSMIVLILFLCGMVPVPGQAVCAASAPDAAVEKVSLRAGDPDFPAPVDLVFDPNSTPLVVDAPLPAARPGLHPASLNITVDYVANGVINALGDTCQTYPAAAKTAFTAAANILQSYISSPVQIRIEACWAALPQYVLGHSSAITFWRDFPNAPFAGIFYPAALANALAASDLNPASDCTGSSPASPAANCDDISLAYASGYASSFYYGIDGKPGINQIDFMSVVLHEIVHGLGFSGKLYAYQSGSTWIGNYSGSNYVRAYDNLAADGSGVFLSNTAVYPRPGAALGSTLVGGNGGVFFNGLNTRYANGGTGARLYTPNPWVGGSSYSHLDISFDGTPNALMTWSISNGESIHALGPVSYGVLKDVGWAPYPATSLSALLSGTGANLTWTNNGGAPTGFRIERSPNGADSWTSRGTAGSSDTSFNDGNLATGIYYYRVVAYNSLGDAYPSNVSQKITVALQTVTALNATPVSDTQVNLTWTNNAPSATAATVQRSLTGETGSWATLITTAAPGSTAGAYNDTGLLTEGTRYYYQVIVTSPDTQSLPSALANARTYLTAPANLNATPASATQINLAWTHASAMATAYTVKRGTDGVNFPTTLTTAAPTGGAPGSITGYNDVGPLTEGVRYYYQVIATNAVPLSSVPVPANAIAMLATPTDLATSAASTYTLVSLTWTNHSTHQTGYDIYRSDGVPTAFVLKGHSATTSYKDTSVVAGMKYNYKVRATNAIDTSADSTILAVVTPQVPPSNFTAVRSGTAVKLAWTDNSANETGFTVERSLDGSTGWVAAGTASPRPGSEGSGSFTDNGSFELADQYYRICAVNTATCSAYVVSAVVPAGATLNTPQPVYSIVLADPTQIKIVWFDNSTLETGFQVQYSLSLAGPWTNMVAATAIDVTSFDWLIADGVYYVRVRALNAAPALDSPFTPPVRVIKSSNRSYFPIVTK